MSIVTLPNGVKVDFDLAKASEKEAYESLMGQVGAQKIAESAPVVEIPKSYTLCH